MLIKNINRIPFTPLIVVALMLGLAPFSPEPHLLEKTRMLLEGSLLQSSGTTGKALKTKKFLIATRWKR